MGSDLSLRLWYGYIIVLMDTIACCVVNAKGILGMDSMMWFMLIDGVSSILVIQW
jgi:hypothetical protein